MELTLSRLIGPNPGKSLCLTIYQLVESIILIGEITEAEEWIDRLDWIPF